MRRTLRIGLVALLVGAGMVIGFEVAGRAGYWEGYCTASTTHEVTNGAIVIAVLGALERGNIDGARNLFESTLDTSISGVWLNSRYSQKLQSFSPLTNADQANLLNSRAKLLKWIAEYRQSHPYEDASGKQAVDWLLARYGTPLQAPR